MELFDERDNYDLEQDVADCLPTFTELAMAKEKQRANKQ